MTPEAIKPYLKELSDDDKIRLIAWLRIEIGIKNKLRQKLIKHITK